MGVDSEMKIAADSHGLLEFEIRPVAAKAQYCSRTLTGR